MGVLSRFSLALLLQVDMMRHRHVLVSTVSFYLQEVSPLGWPCSDGEVNEKKRARLEKVRSGVPYIVQATTDLRYTTPLPLPLHSAGVALRLQPCSVSCTSSCAAQHSAPSHQLWMTVP